MTTCICKASFCFWGWGDGLWRRRELVERGKRNLERSFHVPWTTDIMPQKIVIAK